MSYTHSWPHLFSPRLLSAASALLAASVSAQTAPASGNSTMPTAAEAQQGIGLVLVTSYEHLFSANVYHGNAGSVRSDRFNLGAQLTQDLWGGNMTTGVSYSYLGYDFRGTTGAFGDVNKLGASDYYTQDIQDNWGAFGYIAAGFASETSASFSDGAQLAVAAGPTYKVNENLDLAAGPMFYTRLEDSGTFTLKAEANWKFLPQWNLHAYAGIANGVTVAYDIFNNNQTVVFASADYNSNWMRLSALPAGNRSVNETDTVLKLGVRQIFAGHYFVRGYISSVLDREYQFHVNGSSSYSFDVRDAFGAGVELGVAM